jgi:O-antigen ligase
LKGDGSLKITALSAGRRSYSFLLVVVLAQTVCVVALLIDARLALALVAAVPLFVVSLRHPYLAVLVLLAARLGITKSMSLHVGWVAVSAFEPAFLLAFCVVALRTVEQRRSRLRSFPGAGPMLMLVLWTAISLTWSPAPGEGMQTVIRLVITLALVWIMASEIRTPARFEGAMWIWILVPCVVGFGALFLGGSESPLFGNVAFKAMSGGGRMGGLGQHPNWFAMNMAWGINPALAMAVAERRRSKRLVLLACALWLLLMAVSTGSRGAVWGTAVGSLFLALSHTRVRRFLLRYWFAIAALFVVALTAGMGSFTAAFVRVATRGIDSFWAGNVRFSAWYASFEMMVESFGLGAGAGSYLTRLADLNPRLAASCSAYPHGIFWDVMAHYGVIGIALLAVVVIIVAITYRRAVRLARGTVIETWLHGVAAALVGYFAHSWVEFRLLDKPMWTLLGILFGLCLTVEKLAVTPGGFDRYRSEEPTGGPR